MPYLRHSPMPPVQRRGGPRVQFPEITPAVLRLSDGARVPGKLQVVSITGGLLDLARPVTPDSLVKLMFVGPTGSVLGTAKMLTPIAWRVQPFRFVRLQDQDQIRLRAAIESSLETTARKDEQTRRDHRQIEKSRPW